MPRYQVEAEFDCPECSSEVATTVPVPEPNYAAEDGSDMTVFGDTYASCPGCGTEFHFSAWSGPHSCSLEFPDYPDRKVRVGTPSYSSDEWENYATPESPYEIFVQSDAQLTEVLEEQGSPFDGADLINRMVFAHYIGALEAYLADTLLNAVETNERVFTKLLTSDDELRREKVGLVEVAKNPDWIKNRIRTYLRDVRWHNLAKADALYKVALDIDLFKILGTGKERLFVAVQRRHDCVHRNGFDVSGNRLTVFTAGYVRDLAKLVRRLVEGIHERMELAKVELPF